ncbi:MAG TPA: Uma2 family endonuclease [Streptosporangiaceae bacterium]|nr:Uma2 family endonuclease [Streptosporangiaceae bacterium]
MTSSRTVLPDDRPLTVEDLDLLPDDGNRYELDDGVLVVSPAPAINHQLVLARLTVLLEEARPAEFLVLPGPGVEMSKFQYRIPDLAVVHIDAIDIDGKSVTNPPVLAIEIASPSTAIYDRNRKKEVYAGFGIASYWIVTPSLDKPRLVALELRRGSYREAAEVSGDEVFVAVRPFAVEIVPSALVAGPWQNRRNALR